MNEYPDRAALFEAFAAHVNAGKATFFESVGFDAVIGERGGAVFHDAFDDRQWFNCHSNGGVFNLGHRNPEVLGAVRDALDRVDIGNHHLVSGYRTALAERLSATTGDLLSGVVFGVSGGEAIDLAIKVARASTGRSGVVSAIGGYHGHTGLALAAGDPEYRDPFGPNPPEFSQVPFDDLEALAAAVDGTTAAVLLEPIPATLGMPIPSPDYLAGVRAICDRHGACLILDEVQTGLGRTGRMWSWQHVGVVPDVLVTGKGLSGGIYPITATVMTRELHSLFDTDPFVHISTYGGAEPGCAAALAVLDIVEAPGFLDRVEALGQRFEAGFDGAPFSLRRRGMFMGLAFTEPDGGMVATKALFDEGVFALYANNDQRVLQFLPPMILSDDDADEIITIVRRVLG
ncbi:MAG: aminotransferase class III-fold pyridoxal phosphate-dependent enzyme [Acidimicrobiia bacterium]|nr:aminotransferase class III-fold pyridoxal phosphate-dependent enzyme [Acidimicrobiia bacterium]